MSKIQPLKAGDKLTCRFSLFLKRSIEIGQSGKSSWDVLSVLGVPFSLAILGYWLQQLQQKQAAEFQRSQQEQAAEFQRSQQEQADKSQREQQEQADKSQKLQREQASEEAKEETLQAYFDRLSTLLIDKNVIAISIKVNKASKHQEDTLDSSSSLIHITEEKELVNAAVDVIRARTLSILRRFEGDRERKGDVIRFLVETEIVSKLKLDLSNANLRGADLSFSNLSGANLEYADLRSANLSDANLIGTNLSIADLSNADLSNAKLNNADLSFAALSDFSLYFQGIKLDYRHAKLRGNYISGANLSDADLIYADLSGANLSRVNLSGAFLCNAFLCNADLSNAKLKDTDLSDADFSDANLTNADLSNAKYNDSTTLPSSIDPIARGMVKIELEPPTP